MDWWIFAGVAVVLIVLGILAQKLGWIDMSNKARSGGSGGAMGIGDEVFHPTRHEAQIEMDRQTVLPAPAPLPGDGDLDIAVKSKGYDGQVTIDLSERRRG